MWCSVNTNKPVVSQECEWLNSKSVPVLCRIKSGRITVCVLELDDEGIYHWYEDDSEYWNVSHSVTHWMYLPEFKE